MDDLADPVVVTGAQHVAAVRADLADMERISATVIAEPAPRNTAAAIALAAHVLDPEDIMLVLPSDAHVADEPAFRDALGRGLNPAREGHLVTFGVHPTRPETGYGYMEFRDTGGEWAAVARFVEKPAAELAVGYVDSGRFLWNAGMFMFEVETLQAELAKHAPDVASSVAAAWDSSNVRDGVIHPGEAFESSPSISIDHAVMERSDRVVVVPLAAGWSDVGSWEAWWEIELSRDPDDRGNVVVGPVVVDDVTGSYVRADGRHVVVLGLTDVVVVDTGDALLVANKHRSQEIKDIVEQLPPDLR